MKRLAPNDVLPGGATYQEARDAIAAAGSIRQWDTALDIARRFKLQDRVCLACGVETTAQTCGYINGSGAAVRVCLDCRGRYRR
jgi:hypothetical protein